MQLMPATARRFGVGDSFDPRQNIFGGVQYLRLLLDHVRGRRDAGRSPAYNAGENAVLRYRGVPPYKETRSYVAEDPGAARRRHGARRRRRQAAAFYTPSDAPCASRARGRRAASPRRARARSSRPGRASTTAGRTRAACSTSPQTPPPEGVVYTTIRALD